MPPNCFETKGKFWTLAELNTYLQDLLDGYNYRYNETWTMLILDLFSKQGIRDRA